MNSLRLSILLMCAALSACGGGSLQRLERPAYPIIARVQTWDTYNQHIEIPQLDDAVFEPLLHYNALWCNDEPLIRQVAAYMKRANAGIPVCSGMQVHNTQQSGELRLMETEHRDGIAMIDVTTLRRDCGAAGTRIQIVIPEDGELPILASTADVSDEGDASIFCFWIRIDEEEMKVLAVDRRSGILTVERGFYSQAAPHAAGAMVLTPVYVGRAPRFATAAGAGRSSRMYPHDGRGLQYTLDPGVESVQRLRAGAIARLMQEHGYTGCRLDHYDLRFFNMCDALGNKIQQFWNFQTGRRFTVEERATAMDACAAGLHRYVLEQTGQDPYLIANNLVSIYHDGGKELLRSAQNPDGLDVYTFEDTFLHPQVLGETPNRRVEHHPITGEAWLERVRNLQDCARSGLHGSAFVTAAGYLAGAFNPEWEQFESQDRFCYTSFLLAVTKDCSISLGLGATLRETNAGYAFIPIPDQYYLPIGNPVEKLSLDEYEISGTGCYARRFENAVVFVNPNEDGVRRFSLTTRFMDAAERLQSDSLELPAADGRIVMLRDVRM